MNETSDGLVYFSSGKNRLPIICQLFNPDFLYLPYEKVYLVVG